MNTAPPVKRGIILDVPYSQKDHAKGLGAYWDPQIRKWFVPVGVNPAPFAKWRQKSENEAGDIER